MGRKLLELGWSKEEFAVKLGRSIATVYNMLAGRRVSEKTAYDASILLKVDLDELVGKHPRRTA